MKAFLLLLALGATTPALAQSTVASPGIEALDAKNGFRSYKFGTPLSALPEMQKRGKYYINPLELREIEGIELDKLMEFYFQEGKLCSIIYSATSTSQPSQLFELLTRQYGPPQVVSDTKWLWAGKQVTMTYTELMLTANVGYVGIPVKRGIVVIETTEAAARRQAAVKSGARLPNTGL